MTVKHISLGDFERRHGINKGSVSKRARELGYSTASGLSPAAYQAMCQAFDVVPWVNGRPPAAAVGPTGAQAIAPEVLPEGFIQRGALAAVEERQLQLPRGFDPSAMVKFFDGVAGQATDTATLVQIADMALTSVEGAMEQKLREQRQQLSRSERDAKTLAGRMNEAKTRLQVKALESKLLAERQTDATVSAEALFTELMAMGKPQEVAGDAAADGSTSP
jgi:hypothetical protein